MAKFNVMRDTLVCHLGKTFVAGEVAEFDVPMVFERDIHGRVVKDAEGKPKGKPMAISNNLELIVEDKPAVKK